MVQRSNRRNTRTRNTRISTRRSTKRRRITRTRNKRRRSKRRSTRRNTRRNTRRSTRRRSTRNKSIKAQAQEDSRGSKRHRTPSPEPSPEPSERVATPIAGGGEYRTRRDETRIVTLSAPLNIGDTVSLPDDRGGTVQGIVGQQIQPHPGLPYTYKYMVPAAPGDYLKRSHRQAKIVLSDSIRQAPPNFENAPTGDPRDGHRTPQKIPRGVEEADQNRSDREGGGGEGTVG